MSCQPETAEIIGSSRYATIVIRVEGQHRLAMRAYDRTVHLILDGSGASSGNPANRAPRG